jgi:predicted transcriptional regulator
VALINRARASDERSRQYYQKKVREYKDKSMALTHRLEFKNELNESDQAIFYSSWVYSAVRLLTAIPKFNTAQSIAEELNLTRQKVNNVLDFLVSRNLVAKNNDHFNYAIFSTYVDRDSPFASKHNLNWRLKTFERLEQVARNEIVYTNPIVIAESDFERVTELIVKFIDELRKIADPSPSEILCCLNIDWLKLSTMNQTKIAKRS